MTPTEILQIIANGEGPTVEFKREFSTDIDREAENDTNMAHCLTSR